MATSRNRGELVLAKGGFVLRERGRGRFEASAPMQLGQAVNDFRLDPRDGKTLLLSATGGHLGPTILRSENGGKTWKEAAVPPRFRPVPRGRKKGIGTQGRAVKTNFWLEPGHPDERDTWYCGTAPYGLFRSEDGGRRWTGVLGFNENPRWKDWTDGGKSDTPTGGIVHSICIDPRDAEHLYISLSGGGTFESLDAGASWRPLNKGVAADFMPGPPPEYGHDPHCMILHPADPDRLYQQNHCGIYRLDRRKSERWKRIGRNMPKAIGDIGFPIVGHPRDRDVVWVFPMDGTLLWPRTSPGGKPAVFRTRNGGATWQRLDRGLPRERAWLTVFRQAMDCDGNRSSPRLAFGTTGGEVYLGTAGGERWQPVAAHLPRIHSLRWARLS
jgi:hypothetical protein